MSPESWVSSCSLLAQAIPKLTPTSARHPPLGLPWAVAISDCHRPETPASPPKKHMEETYSHGFAAPREGAAQDTGKRTADILVDMLIEAGVDVVFGLPGGAIAPLNDA